MNVNTSSSGPMVTLVTACPPNATRDTWYGLTPPATFSPQCSQVWTAVVTFGVTVAGFFGAGG